MDELSNNSSIYNPELSPPQFTPPDFVAIKKLSQNLETLLFSPDYFADAHILTAAGDEIPVHRCILSARSPFFRDKFREVGARLELKELANDYVISLEALETVVAYLYTGKVRASPVGVCVCVCVDEECGHVACRPAVEYVVEILYASFCFQISDLVSICQRHLLDVIDKVAEDDVLMVLCVANICRDVCDALLARCIEIVVNSDVDVVTLEKVLANELIVKEIMDARVELHLIGPDSMNYPDKHVKRIHRALDSDDVELVRMLLKEGNTSLDDACALHYAVAYCNAKTTTDLLDLAIADVNHTNSRGYTVLHVAAIRREPKIIVSLLTKGARPTDLTSDGRKALHISRRLTKAADYRKAPEKGRDTHKDRLCIEILEQAEYNPILGEASVTLAIAGDDLRMRLLYLENRVSLAKLLFPMEAKVAMDIARVEGTSEFPGASINFRVLADAHRTTVDLNDAPFKIKEEHLDRLRALSKTVELGKRFFPRCSQVLDKIMDIDDLSQLAFLSEEYPDERENKRQRYLEIQDLVTAAFTEDKEEFRWYNNLSSSSSSTSLGITRNDFSENDETSFLQ